MPVRFPPLPPTAVPELKRCDFSELKRFLRKGWRSDVKIFYSQCPVCTIPAARFRELPEFWFSPGIYEFDLLN
jgi:hypothetical protein